MIGDAYSDIKHYNLIKDNLHLFPIEFILYPQITDVDIALDIGSKRIDIFYYIIIVYNNYEVKN